MYSPLSYHDFLVILRCIEFLSDDDFLKGRIQKLLRKTHRQWPFIGITALYRLLCYTIMIKQYLLMWIMIDIVLI